MYFREVRYLRIPDWDMDDVVSHARGDTIALRTQVGGTGLKVLVSASKSLVQQGCIVR
jgi:hypothetical protein